MSALLEIKDLSIGYKTDTSYVYAVNGVDLTIRTSEQPPRRAASMYSEPRMDMMDARVMRA